MGDIGDKIILEEAIKIDHWHISKAGLGNTHKDPAGTQTSPSRGNKIIKVDH